MDTEFVGWFFAATILLFFVQLFLIAVFSGHGHLYTTTRVTLVWAGALLPVLVSVYAGVTALSTERSSTYVTMQGIAVLCAVVFIIASAIWFSVVRRK